MVWVSGLFAGHAVAEVVSVAVAAACAQRQALSCSWARTPRCTKVVVVVAVTTAGPLFESALLRRLGLMARSKKNTFAMTI